MVAPIRTKLLRLPSFALWLYCLFAGAPHAVVAQSGNYFLTHLTPTDEKIDPRSSAMAQDTWGVMYFTNKNGVLEYDGNRWRLINAPGSAYAILSTGNKIFVGGAFGLGVLDVVPGKAPIFSSLTDKPHIFSINKVGNTIYFCQEETLYSYSLDQQKINSITLSAPSGDGFNGLHTIQDVLYVTTINGRMFTLNNGKLVAVNLALPPDDPMIFSLAAGKTFIIGTESGKIYSLDNANQITSLALADAAYIEQHVLLNAAWVDKNLLALGTLRGGVVFVDMTTGATHEIVNYDVGLPDNDVTALFTDQNQGVWVAHEYGFTRVAPYLPFRSYNHYPGLSGNLLCVQETNGQLLAGTTLGLFYLKTEEQYEEVVSYVSGTTKIKAKEIEPVKQTASEEKEKSRKRLFGIRKNKEQTKSATAKTTVVSSTSKSKSTSQLIKKTDRVLKSRNYQYQKIDGIDGKVTQIISVNGKTFVAGLGGAFMLNGLAAQTIFDEPVRYMFYSPTLRKFLVSTFDDRTVCLQEVGKQWQATHAIDTLRDYISYIFEDNLQNIWLCAKTQVYKMELLDGAVSTLTSIAIHNPLFDETVGLALGNDTYIAASGTFLRYQTNGQFAAYDSLPGPKKYFTSDGNLWFNDGHQWQTLNRKMQRLQLEWLGLFPNLRYLTPLAGNTGFWLVTAENELYQFINPTQQKTNVNYPLLLRDVRGEQVRLLEPRSLRLEQSQNEVHFEFTQPNFTGFRATEFRWRVRGLTAEWSSWASDNVMRFSYLPPGQYQLEVQSRDVLGNQSPIELVNFEVLPYYWKRWWFYALELIFFSLLVLASIRLGRSDNRYRVVSQILSMLSIILLIQFIETGISSFIEFKSSPVVQFIIQLGIALVVFPIEAQLQKFLQLAKEGRFKV
jgi:hypothetical protein